MTAPQHDSSDGGQQLLLGKKLLERGLITPDQLREALVERARHVASGDRSGTPLGGILVSKGYLTDAQLADVQGVAPASPEAPASVSLPPVEAGASTTAARLGKYVLVGELGRGGMGVVYEALDSQLNRKVALKLMLPSPNQDPKSRQLELDRFSQEAQLSAKLKHPNIVTVYEAGVLDGRQFLAMELIEGKAFSEWRHGASVRDQVALLRDVAAAVHHAHEQGILHRDLKPRNILVGAGNRPFVTDFGLAKSLGKDVNLSLTGSGAVVGTPAYMSPEQAQGMERVDWRTDIWSLGVILYEIMVGRTPFAGDSPIEILMKVVKDPVVPPLQAAEGASALGLDKALENICLKALAKKDKDRYVTAQALADDLTLWLSGEHVKVSAPKPRKARRASPHRRLYFVTGLLFLLTAAGLGWILFGPGASSVTSDLLKARRLMDDGRFNEALVLYRSVLAREPENKDAAEGEGLSIRGRDVQQRGREGQDQQKVDRLVKELEGRLKAVGEVATQLDASRSEEERRKLEGRRREEMEQIRRLEKELELLRFKQSGPAATAVKPPPASGLPSDEALKVAANLMAYLDPARYAVSGGWSLQDGRLVSDTSAFARLEIPYAAPAEYDLRVVFIRQSGTDAVALLLAGPRGNFACLVGAEDSGAAGFADVAGDPGDALRRGERFLENDRPHTAVVQVRRGGVKLFLDGREIAQRATDFADLSLPEAWRLRNPGVLGVGSHRSATVFQRIDLLEVAERGRRAPPSPPLSLRAVPVAAGTLKPGLIAEGYFGQDFQVPAIRRVDASPTSDWKEGPAWAGGPIDAFCMRWRGFLQFPRSGRYTLFLTSDEAVRLVLDDVQLIAAPALARANPLTATFQAEEGYHRLVLESSDESFRASLALAWAEGPDAAPVLVPAKACFHTASEFESFLAPRPPELLAELKGHSNSVTGVAFRPDGKVVASASEDHRVRFWDTSTRKDVGQPAVHSKGVICVAFSRDGKTFATGAWDTKIRLWDAGTTTIVKTFDGHTSFIQGVAFSPDGRLLASASYDRTVRLWDLETGQTAAVLQGHASGIEAVAFSPDSRWIVTASLDHSARLWEVQTGMQVRAFEGHVDGVSSAAFGPGGKLLATGSWDGTVRLWDVESGSQKSRIDAGVAGILAVALSPDGRSLATGGIDGLAAVWDVESGKRRRLLPGHAGRVISVAFAADGRRLATGSFDGTARLWDVGSK